MLWNGTKQDSQDDTADRHADRFHVGDGCMTIFGGTAGHSFDEHKGMGVKSDKGCVMEADWMNGLAFGVNQGDGAGHVAETIDGDVVVAGDGVGGEQVGGVNGSPCVRGDAVRPAG